MTKRKAKGPGRSPLPDVIRRLVSEGEGVSAGDVARAAGVTRQAAHYHLARMVRNGELERRGQGRASRYVGTSDLALALPLEGLEEDRAWREAERLLPELAGARGNVHSIVAYAFTEMLNNAIDHSGGAEARVAFWVRPERVAFEVQDDGVGVFRHLRDRLALDDDLAALQQLSKGRETTAPEAHTGEGIFFTSRAVDRFELDANGMRWVVDAARGDLAVGEGRAMIGTTVRCEVDPSTERTMSDVFDGYVNPETLEFSRTVVPLRVFQPDDRLFVSRSEAKRIATRLERFTEVELDFDGITEVGQGFVDELFRVWAGRHPETSLVPVRMSPIVERVVRRAMRPM